VTTDTAHRDIASLTSEANATFLAAFREGVSDLNLEQSPTLAHARKHTGQKLQTADGVFEVEYGAAYVHDTCVVAVWAAGWVREQAANHTPVLILSADCAVVDRRKTHKDPAELWVVATVRLAVGKGKVPVPVYTRTEKTPQVQAADKYSLKQDAHGNWLRYNHVHRVWEPLANDQVAAILVGETEASDAGTD